MSRAVKPLGATGTGALALSSGTLSDTTQVVGIFVHLSAAPTSAGSLTITLNSHLGAAYDTVLQSVDMIGVTDVFFQPEHSLRIVDGDAIDIAYANPDARTIGASIYVDISATE